MKQKRLSRKEEGMLHSMLFEGSRIFLRETKHAQIKQLIAQEENQLENFRDKPQTFTSRNAFKQVRQMLPISAPRSLPHCKKHSWAGDAQASVPRFLWVNIRRELIQCLTEPLALGLIQMELLRNRNTSEEQKLQAQYKNPLSSVQAVHNAGTLGKHQSLQRNQHNSKETEALQALEPE